VEAGREKGRVVVRNDEAEAEPRGGRWLPVENPAEAVNRRRAGRIGRLRTAG
jgi:hypothetical protein